MPTIFFYGPKLDKDKSREMIKSIKTCFANICNKSILDIVIL